jgi:polysaccharide export outer membrane protein
MSMQTQTMNKKKLGSIIAVLAFSIVGSLSQAQESAPPASQESQANEYLIGPGDTLNVFVWRQPDLTANIPVRPDGMISTPLVEDMVAVGKTPTELADDIEEVLSEYIRSPQVTIIVEGFVGTFNAQVRVLGQAVNPGVVAYRDRMTLLDVMLEVGGLTEFASGNRARLVRKVDGKNEETRVRLDNLLNKGDLDENFVVQPGDVIVIPEAVF